MALPAPTARERLLRLEAELDALAQASKELSEEEHAVHGAEAELMRSLARQRSVQRARAIALARRTSLEQVERTRISALPSEISLLLFNITFKPLLPSTTLIHSNPSASDAQEPTKLLRSTHIASIFSLRLGKLAPLPSPSPLSSHPASNMQGIDLSPDRDLPQAGRGVQGRSIGQVPVHELNAALGQLAFGLVCLGRRCGLPWRHLSVIPLLSPSIPFLIDDRYRIEPHASQSIIHKYNPPHWEAHELSVSLSCLMHQKPQTHSEADMWRRR